LPPVAQSRQLAPLWHTAIVVFVLLGSSLAGARAIRPHAGHSKLPEYLAAMVWQWIVVGFIFLGIRKRIKLRQLIGGRWTDFEAFLLDVVIAAGFWVFAVVVLAVCGKLLHLDDASRLESMRRQIGFLVPGTTVELLAWFCVSITAGFCEEIIFRGYLQRQFTVLSRSMLGGVMLSAVVFGAAHGYEGGARMLLIAIFGLMFGLLAWWRKSLRPGMIAHAWHDAFSGAVMRMMK
jgi:membrane protease YdiL (CAAX protease family)